MTPTLMARLWIVPALVVVVMIGVAMVVILFGASPIDKPQSVDALLAQIEADSGERSAAGLMLMPRSKQAWQAAQELALRFEKGDVTEKERNDALARIGAMVRSFDDAAPMEGDDRGVEAGLAMRQFLVIALARLHSPDAIEPIVRLLDEKDPSIRRIAVQALAEMKDVDGIQDQLPRMYPLLDGAQPTEVRMVAALAVSSVADHGDATAIEKISRMSDDDLEVRMSKATALANLGSTRGKLTLLNMLSREFWTGLKIDDGSGASAKRSLTEPEIASRIIAVAPVAARLGDDDVNKLLNQIAEKDPSVQVREGVRAAIAAVDNDAASSVDGVGAESLSRR